MSRQLHNYCEILYLFYHENWEGNSGVTNRSWSSNLSRLFVRAHSKMGKFIAHRGGAFTKIHLIRLSPNFNILILIANSTSVNIELKYCQTSAWLPDIEFHFDEIHVCTNNCWAGQARKPGSGFSELMMSQDLVKTEFFAIVQSCRLKNDSEFILNLVIWQVMAPESRKLQLK